MIWAGAFGPMAFACRGGPRGFRGWATVAACVHTAGRQGRGLTWSCRLGVGRVRALISFRRRSAAKTGNDKCSEAHCPLVALKMGGSRYVAVAARARRHTFLPH